MARKLVFETDQMFQLAHEGFLLTASGKSREEHRMIGRVLDRFDSISIEGDTAIPGLGDPAAPKRRHLDPTGDRTLILEESEYECLKRSLERIQCAAAMSRQVTRLHDFIDAAPAGDPKELLRVV